MSRGDPGDHLAYEERAKRIREEAGSGKSIDQVMSENVANRARELMDRMDREERESLERQARQGRGRSR